MGRCVLPSPAGSNPTAGATAWYPYLSVVELRFKAERRNHAKNHAVPVVRRQSRGSSEILHLHFQELKDRQRLSPVRDLPARRTKIPRAERRIQGILPGRRAGLPRQIPSRRESRRVAHL